MNISNITEKVKSTLKPVKIKLPGWKDLKSNKKLLGAVAGALVVVICITAFGISKLGDKDKKQIMSSFVTRGSVTKVIEGSGTIEALDQYEITALVKGEILNDYFEEGQEVKEGDLLYSIDYSEIENNIEKSQLSYQQSQESLSNLTVRSNISGTVTQVYISNGDNVGSNSKVADIINSDYMRLKINFNYVDAQNMYRGQMADVYLSSSSNVLSGEVESVATGSIISDSGAPVTPVEIVVKNPGAIRPGDIATAVVGQYACNDAGTFEYYETSTVYAKSSGEAYGLSYKAGDKIQKGAPIVYLESTSTYVNARQNQLALESLIKDRDDYNITAPISGKVIQKNSKAGDKLDNTNSNTTMAIIADLSSLVFEISVDELDISNIEVGQTVSVTADALEGKVFTGYVENVSIVGTSANGVTSYPVKVVMNDGVEDGLIPGMNVNASIVIDSREDVLRVPISAINRGNIVYVKSNSDSAKNSDKKADGFSESNKIKQSGEDNKPADMPMRDSKDIPSRDFAGTPSGASKDSTEIKDNMKNSNMANSDIGKRLLENMQKNAPDGYTAVIVEVGLSDGSFAEIISGLSEGDEVYIPDVTTGGNTMAGMMGAMGGMPGGMGGMPGGMGGGMPGGMGGNRNSGMSR